MTVVLTIFSVGASGPTGVVRMPSGQAATIAVSAAVGLAATAIFLSMVVIASFIYLWRKASVATSEKMAVVARFSTIAHSGSSSSLQVIDAQ
jgi:hypothetical protein